MDFDQRNIYIQLNKKYKKLIFELKNKINKVIKILLKK